MILNDERDRENKKKAIKNAKISVLWYIFFYYIKNYRVYI